MDGTVDELLVFAAKQVNGRQKRSIFAAVCAKLCDGSARKTEERFGWSREAVAKGLLERVHSRNRFLPQKCLFTHRSTFCTIRARFEAVY